MRGTAAIALFFAASTAQALVSGLQPTGQKPGTIKFYAMEGLCGTGKKGYVGWIEPAVLIHEKKFFLELMGGAVCFNKDSCQEEWLRAWMDLDVLFVKLHLPADITAFLKGGGEIAMSVLAALNPGYQPTDDSHPMWGRRGIYYPTCTGDVMMGKHTIEYEGGMVAHHHGAANLDQVLKSLLLQLPDLEEFAIYGGSGGGVASSLWMTELADRWPTAQVYAMVDSGFHMMPGSSFFNFFYNHVLWSTGPGGQNEFVINRRVDMPVWNWTNKYAISEVLQRYRGRVKIAYIACDEDRVVFSDREKMSQFSEFSGNSIQQRVEMWDMLTNLHKCAPAGTVFSYLSHCSEHHLTREGFPLSADIPGEISQKTFVENFLLNKPIDVESPTRTNFWHESHDMETEGKVCPAPLEPEASGGVSIMASSLWQLLIFGGGLSLLISALGLQGEQ